jgi:hypothetical protein
MRFAKPCPFTGSGGFFAANRNGKLSIIGKIAAVLQLGQRHLVAAKPLDWILPKLMNLHGYVSLNNDYGRVMALTLVRGNSRMQAQTLAMCLA